MNFEDAVAARRSVRAFLDEPVPRSEIERALGFAVQAPAPHHSAPWRFVILNSSADKERFSAAMGAAWRRDLAADGVPGQQIEAITGRSHALLTATPTLVVCCADMSRAHDYADDRRRRAEWSLFAHSVGAALQTFMMALATSGIASCWISAPVFCGEVVRADLGLDATVEPHALVLVGHAAPDYKPRPRPAPDPSSFIVRP